MLIYAEHIADVKNAILLHVLSHGDSSYYLGTMMKADINVEGMG